MNGVINMINYSQLTETLARKGGGVGRNSRIK